MHSILCQTDLNPSCVEIFPIWCVDREKSYEINPLCIPLCENISLCGNSICICLYLQSGLEFFD